MLSVQVFVAIGPIEIAYRSKGLCTG